MSKSFFAWGSDTPTPTPIVKPSEAVRIETKTVTEYVPALTRGENRDLEVLERLLRGQAKDMAWDRRKFGDLSVKTELPRIMGETACRKYANILNEVRNSTVREVV